MKHILNFIKGTLFTLWLIIAIFTTICLLSYNDYQVSEFGKYSLLIINNKELRSVYELSLIHISNGCQYYELIKIKNENGTLEKVLEGVKYYFLVTRDTNIAVSYTHLVWYYTYF